MASPEAETAVTAHHQTAEDVVKAWGSSATEGLNEDQVETARERWGKNELPPPKTTPAWLMFLEELCGFFSLLLWLAAALCFLGYALDGDQVENLYLGIVLSVVTLMTGIFSFYQNYKSAEAMASFKAMLPPHVIVVRTVNGQVDKPSIAASNLVPGDIVEVQKGDKFPADMRIIKSADLEVDNASLTGESDAQKRDFKVCAENIIEEHATNVVFYGTSCVKGTATCVVYATGPNTVIGKIANLVQATDNGKTPIALEIEHFIHIVSAVAVFLGVTFLIIGFAKGTDAITNLVFAIGIIVANVPEGLLATVTVSLTLTAKRMAKKQVLVKNLEAVETLGSTTVIASDKTGTLTQNRMTATSAFYDLDTKICYGGGAKGSCDVNDPTCQMLMKVLTLCNTTRFASDTEVDGEKVKDLGLNKDILMRKSAGGDASETAMIKWTEPLLQEKANLFFDGKDLNSSGELQCSGDRSQLQYIQRLRDVNTEVAAIPFNSANKFQVSINMQGKDSVKGEDAVDALEQDMVLYMKGAPEKIFSRCDKILVDGKERDLTPEDTQKIKDALSQMMFQGYRVLGGCYATLDKKKYPRRVTELTEGGKVTRAAVQFNTSSADEYDFPFAKGQGLVFCGLIALQDPPRLAVPSAVLSCQTAGIKVVMVTGDHPETAEAIAKQVNIIRSKTGSKTRRDVARERGLNVNDPSLDLKALIPDDEIDAAVVTGKELLTMSQEELDHVLDFDQLVFARTSPEQKLIIVQGLQKKTHNHMKHPPQKVKHVVAVTGDGVNDSPALKAADIGVAMGIAGTQVAKDAADMILLNDNFASIVDGVEEGRLIFDNLKKSIAYTLSSNIPEISPFLIFILVQVPLPLPTVLILCIDLGTDMVPAISLAYENKEANIMRKPPRDMNTERLVTGKLVNFSYLQVGVVQALAGFYTYFVVLNDFGFAPWTLPFFETHFSEYDRYVFESDGISWKDNYNYKNPRGESYQWGKLVGIFDGDDQIRPVGACNVGGSATGGPWGDEDPCGVPYLALRHAQTAYFITIIVVQYADILACKTRELSLSTQGMRNNMLNFGLIFETVLGAALCYITALNPALGTAPLAFEHWLPALPFSLLILSYDEVRKFLLRNMGKDNWVKRNTYY